MRTFQNTLKDPSEPVWESLGETTTASVPIPAHPAFQRILGKLPARILNSFSAEQLRYLAIASQPQPGQHIVDYRASIGFFGKRFYLTVLFGRERRNLERLFAEGQLAARRLTLAYGFMAIIAAAFLTVITIFGLYITKSALNIDLLDGPSTMHEWVFGDEQPSFPDAGGGWAGHSGDPTHTPP
jgi:hypothetical protein